MNTNTYALNWCRSVRTCFAKFSRNFRTSRESSSLNFKSLSSTSDNSPFNSKKHELKCKFLLPNHNICFGFTSCFFHKYLEGSPGFDFVASWCSISLAYFSIFCRFFATWFLVLLAAARRPSAYTHKKHTPCYGKEAAEQAIYLFLIGSNCPLPHFLLRLYDCVSSRWYGGSLVRFLRLLFSLLGVQDAHSLLTNVVNLFTLLPREELWWDWKIVMCNFMEWSVLQLVTIYADNFYLRIIWLGTSFLCPFNFFIAFVGRNTSSSSSSSSTSPSSALSSSALSSISGSCCWYCWFISSTFPSMTRFMFIAVVVPSTSLLFSSLSSSASSSASWFLLDDWNQRHTLRKASPCYNMTGN